MALQLSVTARNARLDAIETTVGTAPIMRIRTGAAPANCAAADTGTVLAALTLPANWMANAASGQKTLTGTWADATADASGTAAHFRIYNSAGTVCHIQGDVGTGTSADLQVDNDSFAAGQSFTVTTFTLTDGNA